MISSEAQHPRVNGQRTPLPGQSAQSPPGPEDRLAQAARSRRSPSAADDTLYDSKAAGLELTEVKQVVTRGGEEKYLWKVTPKGNGRFPSRWVQPGRNMVRSLEEAWYPYGWDMFTPHDQWEVRRDLAAQARNLQPKVVFEVPGWQRYQNQWVFVHAGGAISAGGAVPAVEARLPAPFDAYCLPTPSGTQHERREAALGTLMPLTIGLPIGAIIPLWCALWLPPLRPFLPLDLTIFLHGRTGSFKTSLLRVMLAAWGCPVESQNHFLPYASTTRALEELLERARHLPVVIDDVVPNTTRRDDGKLATILRKVGSGEPRWTFQGRGEPQRLGFEGLLYMTGESPPQTDSLRARSWLISTDKYRISSTSLWLLEEEVIRKGLLSRAMADYLVYLAGRWETLEKQLPQRYERARARFLVPGPITHPRRAGMAALLLLGGELLLEYAESVGAITGTERKACQEFLREVLHHLAEYMDSTPGADQFPKLPASLQFLTYVRMALEMGKGHFRPSERVATGRWDLWGWVPDPRAKVSKRRNDLSDTTLGGRFSGWYDLCRSADSPQDVERTVELMAAWEEKLSQSKQSKKGTAKKAEKSTNKEGPGSEPEMIVPPWKREDPEALPSEWPPEEQAKLRELMTPDGNNRPEEAGWKPLGTCLGYVVQFQSIDHCPDAWEGTLYLQGEEAYNVAQQIARKLRLPMLPPYRTLVEELGKGQLLVVSDKNRHTVRKGFGGTIRRYLAIDMAILREVDHYLDLWRETEDPAEWWLDLQKEGPCPQLKLPPLDPSYGPRVASHAELEEGCGPDPASWARVWLERVVAVFQPSNGPPTPVVELQPFGPAPSDRSDRSSERAHGPRPWCPGGPSAEDGGPHEPPAALHPVDQTPPTEGTGDRIDRNDRSEAEGERRHPHDAHDGEAHDKAGAGAGFGGGDPHDPPPNSHKADELPLAAGPADRMDRSDRNPRETPVGESPPVQRETAADPPGDTVPQALRAIFGTVREASPQGGECLDEENAAAMTPSGPSPASPAAMDPPHQVANPTDIAGQSPLQARRPRGRPPKGRG